MLGELASGDLQPAGQQVKLMPADRPGERAPAMGELAPAIWLAAPSAMHNGTSDRPARQ